jgi:hypothetical protein
MDDCQYNLKEFVFDIVLTDDGDYIVASHPASGRLLPPVRLRDLTKHERHGIRERLMEQLSEELRAAGIAPKPELQPGNGIKKAGKQRWSVVKKDV